MWEYAKAFDDVVASAFSRVGKATGVERLQASELGVELILQLLTKETALQSKGDGLPAETSTQVGCPLHFALICANWVLFF